MQAGNEALTSALDSNTRCAGIEVDLHQLDECIAQIELRLGQPADQREWIVRPHPPTCGYMT